MNLQRFIFAWTMSTLVACSSPGSFNGTIANHKLNVASSAFGTTTASIATLAGSPNTTFGIAMVVLSSHKDVCSQATSQHIAAGDTAFFVGLTKLGGAPGVGVYNAMDPNTAFSDFATFGNAALLGVSFGAFVAEDAHCTNQITGGQGAAVSGTVNVDDITPSAGGMADGSFTLAMGPGKVSVTGTYSAEYCAGISNFLASHFGTSNPNSTPVSFSTIPCQ